MIPPSLALLRRRHNKLAASVNFIGMRNVEAALEAADLSIGNITGDLSASGYALPRIRRAIRGRARFWAPADSLALSGGVD